MTDYERIEWLSADYQRLQDVYWYIQNEYDGEDDIRAAVDVMAERQGN